VARGRAGGGAGAGAVGARFAPRRSEERLPKAARVQRTAYTGARIGAEAPLVAEDLVHVDEVAVIRYREQYRVVRRRDEPLEGATGHCPKLDAVRDAPTEL